MKSKRSDPKICAVYNCRRKKVWPSGKASGYCAEHLATWRLFGQPVVDWDRVHKELSDGSTQTGEGIIQDIVRRADDGGA